MNEGSEEGMISEVRFFRIFLLDGESALLCGPAEERRNYYYTICAFNLLEKM